MLSKSYKYVLDIAPVRITWSQELVDDEEGGCFYLRLTPHVEWAEDKIKTDVAYEYRMGDDGSYHVSGWHNTYSYKPGTVGKIPPSIQGATRRSEIARQGRKIFADLKKEMAADVQKKLRIESNKRRGQRWNKKV